MTGWLVFKRQSLLQPQLYCLLNHDFFLSPIPSINPSLTSDNCNPLLPSSHPTLPLSKVKQLEWIDGFWRGSSSRGGEETRQKRRGMSERGSEGFGMKEGEGADWLE